ncbi:nuclear pore complex protein Nup214-like isoform X2 [Ptychodera flava]|uniref:nuclear pore complex protein Nup214-like isoform X2 n=1 Tax=Ptychodera flava TaxID=63121 RepID=UPI00396A3BFF
MAEVEGDYAVPAERDVSVDEFAFRQMCKVRVSDTKAGKEAHHVLAVSNIYGYTFIGCDKGLKVIQTSALSRLDEDNDSSSIVDDVPCIQEVALPVMPCHVAISSDNLTLSVCYKQSTTIKANFFDIRSLARPNTDFEAFVSVELSEDSDTSLRDLRWNPDSADNAGIFAACFTDGSVSLWQVTTSVTMLCSCDAGVNAICWSPKGKQIVCGTLTGKLIQYDKLLIQKKEIEAPNIFDNDLNIQVVSVVWLSTYSFLAAYNAIESTEQPNLVEVNTTKNGPSTFVNLEDVCYGNGEERDPVYYFEYLAEWQLVVTAQSNAMECIPVGKGESGRWERWSLDDAGRVELPLQDSQDTYPVGTAVDLTSKIQIPIGDNQTMRPAPIYMVLSTEGILCPFYMVYRAEVKDIVNPAKTLKPDGERQSQDTSSPGSSARAAAKLPSIEQVTPQSSGKGAGESLPISTPRGNLLAKFDSEATPKVTTSSSHTIVPSIPSDGSFSSIPSQPSKAVSSISSAGGTSGSRFDFSGSGKPTASSSAPVFAFGGVSSSIQGKPVTSDTSQPPSSFAVAQTRSQTETQPTSALYSFGQTGSSAISFKPQLSTDILQSTNSTGFATSQAKSTTDAFGQSSTSTVTGKPQSAFSTGGSASAFSSTVAGASTGSIFGSSSGQTSTLTFSSLKEGSSFMPKPNQPLASAGVTEVSHIGSKPADTVDAGSIPTSINQTMTKPTNSKNLVFDSGGITNKPVTFGTTTLASTKPTVLPTSKPAELPTTSKSVEVSPPKPLPLGSQQYTDSSSKAPVKPVSTVNYFTTSQSSKGQQTQSKLPSSATSLESSISAIILDEMLRFQRELDELKSKNCDFIVGVDAEKRELLKGKEDLAEFHAEITDCVQA